jgi:hypothetical protein
MPRRRVVRQRASYREGVEWIACNDNVGEDDPLTAGSDGPAQQAIRDRIASYISTALLADLFGADPAAVAADVFRARARFVRARVPAIDALFSWEK